MIWRLLAAVLVARGRNCISRRVTRVLPGDKKASYDAGAVFSTARVLNTRQSCDVGRNNLLIVVNDERWVAAA